MQTRVDAETRLPDGGRERLQLRRFREDDLDPLAVVFAKPEVWKFPYGRGMTRAGTEAFLTAQTIEGRVLHLDQERVAKSRRQGLK